MSSHTRHLWRSPIYKFILSQVALGPWLVPSREGLAALLGDGYRPNTINQSIKRLVDAGAVVKKREGKKVILSLPKKKR